MSHDIIFLILVDTSIPFLNNLEIFFLVSDVTGILPTWCQAVTPAQYKCNTSLGHAHLGNNLRGIALHLSSLDINMKSPMCL